MRRLAAGIPRDGSGEHRPTDINALIDESLKLAYHGARAEKPTFNVTLRRDYDVGIGTIAVFPQEITRVLLNLISNGFYAVANRAAEERTRYGLSMNHDIIVKRQGGSIH